MYISINLLNSDIKHHWLLNPPNPEIFNDVKAKTVNVACSQPKVSQEHEKLQREGNGGL